jgi:hypothetical protein
VRYSSVPNSTYQKQIHRQSRSVISHLTFLHGLYFKRVVSKKIGTNIKLIACYAETSFCRSTQTKFIDSVSAPLAPNANQPPRPLYLLSKPRKAIIFTLATRGGVGQSHWKIDADMCLWHWPLKLPFE